VGLCAGDSSTKTHLAGALAERLEPDVLLARREPAFWDEGGGVTLRLRGGMRLSFGEASKV
jgi:hypothetical protein